MTDLNALIERLEKASGPDRELDLAIHVAVYPDGDIARLYKTYRRGLDHKDGMAWDIWHGGSVCYENYADGRCFSNGGYPLPAVTSSIDAAMTLVPEGFAIRDWMIWPGHPSELTVMETFLDKGQHWHSGDSQRWSAKGTSPAIALCIAALRAKSRSPQP